MTNIVVKLWEREERHFGGPKNEGVYHIYPDTDASQSSSLQSEIALVARREGADLTAREHRDEVEKGLEKKYWDAGFDEVIIREITMAFGGAGAVITFLKICQPALLQWLKNRATRTITIRRGDTVISVEGIGSLEEVVEAMRVLEVRSPPSQANEPKLVPRKPPRKQGRNWQS